MAAGGGAERDWKEEGGEGEERGGSKREFMLRKERECM